VLLQAPPFTHESEEGILTQSMTMNSKATKQQLGSLKGT